MINKQRPIESGFDGTTTAMQALAGKDLHGMTAIVTGGYSGIGLEAVRVLAAAGAQVIVPARTRSRPNATSMALPGLSGATWIYSTRRPSTALHAISWRPGGHYTC